MEDKTFLDPLHPKSPQNPWAFIRVCNEGETLQTSLNSILGAINRGVIVYNECTDRSEQIIHQFCKEDSGFRCFEYPFQVAQVHHLRCERERKRA